jgi:ferric-dicitrate binding protein FerR (iron transport regulator)
MNKDFSQLVSKTLSGEATKEEKDLLGQLLKDSETDNLLYNEIKEYWNAGVNTDKDLSLSVDKKIWSRIDEDRRKDKRRNLINYFYRAAAVILLLITCSVTYYHKTNPSHIYTTYAAKETITDYVLKDGTKVRLNKNSSITFTETFGEKNRRVDLSGEAYFEVTKDAAKTFIVSAQGTETKVLGTQFNIQSDEEQKQVTVALAEGLVRFEAGSCHTLLYPTEEIIYHVATGKYEYHTTDLQFNTAWKEGRYLYQNIPFGELLKKMEHIYGISIDMDYPEIETKKITASFLTEEPIEEILLALERELKFKYKVKGTDIVIEKK